jgi:hypothetical protein
MTLPQPLTACTRAGYNAALMNCASSQRQEERYRVNRNPRTPYRHHLAQGEALNNVRYFIEGARRTLRTFRPTTSGARLNQRATHDPELKEYEAALGEDESARSNKSCSQRFVRWSPSTRRCKRQPRRFRRLMPLSLAELAARRTTPPAADPGR